MNRPIDTNLGYREFTDADGADGRIMVSIICAAYNHGKYIADAIEGFVMQKTTFPFEILIHDDASTDDTAAIIKKYELQYPGLIKPVYQTVNQYQQGRRGALMIRKSAAGKYIAVCEGDDYWTDPYKLKKQVEYMERHPECSLCVHAAFKIQEDKKKHSKPIRPYRKNKTVSTAEVIEGDGGLFSTNSMLYKAELDQKRPSYFDIAPVGDYPLTILLSTRGTIYYMKDIMSAYRVGVPGSWTNRQLSTPEKAIQHLLRIEVMLDEIDRVTEYQYKEAIARTKKRNQLKILLMSERYEEMKAPEFKEFYGKLDKKTRIRILIKQRFPGLLGAGGSKRGKKDQ